MIQGTASSVGKSIMVTALCRIFKQDGLRVAPFKSQNMALNSFVTREGGEIGRAQAVQAEAAGIEPSIYMNPVLIKPEADTSAQVVVMGKVRYRLNAGDYYDNTSDLIACIGESLTRLRDEYDVVVIEGAGSPAEINFREREIVNMRVARMADAPVLLVGDIDRGGVFASLVGTLELLNDDERNRVKGFIINKFRGDVSLLRPGLDFLERKTGRPILGVVPYFKDIAIAQEDSVYLDERQERRIEGSLDIAVVQLPYVSNYDDFDPFENFGCVVRFVKSPDSLEHPDLIIVPGTKNTVNDLRFLREWGLGRAIAECAAAGVPVIGICGGYQMLGERIDDPGHVESNEDSVPGLGLLPVVTSYTSEKTTTQVKGVVAANKRLLSDMKGIPVEGYEIHMGQTVCRVDDPAFHIVETPLGRTNYTDGMVSTDGMVIGTYMHGLFHNEHFTRALVNNLRRMRGLDAMTDVLHRGDEYDQLADHVRQYLDIARIHDITGI